MAEYNLVSWILYIGSNANLDAKPLESDFIYQKRYIMDIYF